jgi:hypothetical protein
MIKQLIIYMGLMILCMLEIIMLIKILKEIMVFFIIKLLDIEMFERGLCKPLKYSIFRVCLTNFQFPVSGIRFFVLTPEPANFNSLYRTSDSLKNQN